MGIYLLLANSTIIDTNLINYNTVQGIYLKNSNYTKIANNILLGNLRGIEEGPNCYYNLFENNNIVNRSLFPEDSYWDELIWGILVGGSILGIVGIYLFIKKKRSNQLNSD